MRSLNPHDQIYFLQGNSPAHKSKLVQNWLKTKKNITLINLLCLLPDLSLIKNIWANIVSKWQKNDINTKEALVKHVGTVWE